MENWLASAVQSFFLTAACLTVGLCRFRVPDQSATLWGASWHFWGLCCWGIVIPQHVDPSICNRAEGFLPWPLQDRSIETVKQMLHGLSANQDTSWVVNCYFCNQLFQPSAEKAVSSFHQKMPSTTEISEHCSIDCWSVRYFYYPFCSCQKGSGTERVLPLLLRVERYCGLCSVCTQYCVYYVATYWPLLLYFSIPKNFQNVGNTFKCFLLSVNLDIISVFFTEKPWSILMLRGVFFPFEFSFFSLVSCYI